MKKSVTSLLTLIIFAYSNQSYASLTLSPLQNSEQGRLLVQKNLELQRDSDEQKYKIKIGCPCVFFVGLLIGYIMTRTSFVSPTDCSAVDFSHFNCTELPNIASNATAAITPALNVFESVIIPQSTTRKRLTDRFFKYELKAKKEEQKRLQNKPSNKFKDQHKGR